MMPSRGKGIEASPAGHKAQKERCGKMRYCLATVFIISLTACGENCETVDTVDGSELETNSPKFTATTYSTQKPKPLIKPKSSIAQIKISGAIQVQGAGAAAYDCEP
jgi:uncharacterized protein Veg